MIDTVLMRAELVRDEKTVCFVYDDATGRPIRPGVEVFGHPTLGVGRALDVDGITEAEALYLLDNDIAKYVSELEPIDWFRALDPVRQRAIVNMRHQLGLAGLLGFHNMIAALERADWPAAVAAGLSSDWARETPERANRVLALVLQAPGEAPQAPAALEAPQAAATV